MKIHPYSLMTLVILAMSSPALVLAETENEANEGSNEIVGKQSTSTQTEQEGNGNNVMNSINSNLILFVTIAAISSVIGYSAWKVYKIRKRSAPKTLV